LQKPRARIARRIPRRLHRSDHDGAWLKIDILVDMITTGLATTTTEHIVAGARQVKVTRMRITEAGRPALARLRWP
jgi:hypothetical protein